MISFGGHCIYRYNVQIRHMCNNCWVQVYRSVVWYSIQCPPKIWRQGYRNCSVLCCYNIYICIRIKQNNNVNDVYRLTSDLLWKSRAKVGLNIFIKQCKVRGRYLWVAAGGGWGTKVIHRLQHITIATWQHHDNNHSNQTRKSHMRYSPLWCKMPQNSKILKELHLR